MKKKYLAISLVLHALLLVSMGATSLSTGAGEFPGGGDQSGRADEVIPKTVEVEIIEYEGDIEVKKVATPEPLDRECVDDLWYGGIGIMIDYSTGRVTETFAGYPAQRFGIIPGDIIMDFKTEDGGDIRGPLGIAVTITITRPPDMTRHTFTMQREKICIKEST